MTVRASLASHARRQSLERDCARFIKRLSADLPEPFMVAIVLFEYEEGGHLAYSTDADRASLVLGLRNACAQLAGEGGVPFVVGSPEEVSALLGMLRELGDWVKGQLQQGVGFATILFDDEGHSLYVSSADRADMVRAIGDLADKVEAGEAGSVFRS